MADIYDIEREGHAWEPPTGVRFFDQSERIVIESGSSGDLSFYKPAIQVPTLGEARFLGTRGAHGLDIPEDEDILAITHSDLYKGPLRLAPPIMLGTGERLFYAEIFFMPNPSFGAVHCRLDWPQRQFTAISSESEPDLPGPGNPIIYREWRILHEPKALKLLVIPDASLLYQLISFFRPRI